MPFISLIIPAFNAQAYLRRCLDSAAAQSFRDMVGLLETSRSIRLGCKRSPGRKNLIVGKIEQRRK